MIYPNNGFLGSQAHHTLKDRRGEDVKFDDQPEADRGVANAVVPSGKQTVCYWKWPLK